jgi:hypothetical protein
VWHGSAEPHPAGGAGPCLIFEAPKPRRLTALLQTKTITNLLHVIVLPAGADAFVSRFPKVAADKSVLGDLSRPSVEPDMSDTLPVFNTSHPTRLPRGELDNHGYGI